MVAHQFLELRVLVQIQVGLQRKYVIIGDKIEAKKSTKHRWIKRKSCTH